VTTRLVFVTQQVDPEHPWLAAAVPKIRALAARVDEVAVLADRAVDGALPGNCRVRLFGAPSRTRRGARFTDALRRELSPRPVAVVVHQIPLFAILAAPLARPRRIPLLLWYTSHVTSRQLLLAERAATAVLTVDRRSFPLRSTKVRAIGHGIDLAAFGCCERAAGGRLRVLALGRTAPSKGLETVVRAARLAGADVEVRGAAVADDDRAVQARLAELGVPVQEPLPHTQVPALLAAKDVLVSNMREGSLDKVVYEAAATCMPVLASNSGFEDVLPPELRFRRDDAADLADRLRALADADRNALGRELRARVEARHSVEHWADEVLRAAAPR
jgi:glycosyltransferase involved in cell wall biosynthesis